jgi:hypothetical protein
MTAPRPIATLKLPRSVPDLLCRALGIVDAMTGNPHFPDPDPTLPAVLAAIGEASDAHTASLSRTRGTRQARNVKVDVLSRVLDQVRTHVQKIADQNPDSGAGIIESAGLFVHKPTAYAKPTFHAQDGRVSGTVKVTAESVRGQAYYDWQQSVDGGETWIDLPTTFRSTITVSGFTPGQWIWFRFRAVTREGKRDWSQPTAIMVG